MHINGQMNLMSLARETLEEIVSNLDSHRDLISLALVSSAWKAIIIPRHSQYRVIRIREDMPRLWEHLAQRADLARTVKVVHLYDEHDLLSLQIYPTTLVDGTEEPGEPVGGGSWEKKEDRKIRNMCRALRHMTGLREFAWTLSSSTYPTSRSVQEEAIFLALSQCPSLAHLALWGRFAERVVGNSGYGVFPLWKLSNLESLTVNGGTWVNRMNAANISAMLKRSPRLKSLTFPMEFTALPHCRFPQLRKLALVLQSGATSRIDASRVYFIEAHPTIEELHWYPIGDVTLAPGSLPAITRLSTRGDLALSILLDQLTPPRPLKHLCGLLANSKTVRQLEAMTVCSVQTLRLARYDDLQSVAKLADIFPALTSLEMPPYATLPDGFNILCFPPRQWIGVLRLFPHLERFMSGGLWAVQGSTMTEEQLDEIIQEIARACPKLREIEHWQIDDNRGCCKWIVIQRTGAKVSWGIESPPLRFAFESIMKDFD